jgi:hypothetical protein
MDLRIKICTTTGEDPEHWFKVFSSVPSDPGCLSRIPDPDFYPSRIPDPGSRIQEQQQKSGVKKICCHNFLCSHKFHKIASYFSFEVLKKNIWANFQRIIELFPKKLSISSQKYGFGIRIRDPEKTYSRSRTQRSKRRRIPDPDPQHWFSRSSSSLYIQAAFFHVILGVQKYCRK